jgi:hypothetical protein
MSPQQRRLRPSSSSPTSCNRSLIQGERTTPGCALTTLLRLSRLAGDRVITAKGRESSGLDECEGSTAVVRKVRRMSANGTEEMID